MLNRFYLIIGFVLGSVTWSDAQITKEFKVEDKTGYNLVRLDFNVYKGISQIKRDRLDGPLYIHSELNKINILPSFSYRIKDDVLLANLSHRNVESENLGKSLSYKLFSSSNEDFDHKWDVGLNSHNLYDLHFYFGIGYAEFDLSHLPISNFHIKSTSADIMVDYSDKFGNSVKMDTLSIEINMGNIEASNLNFTNAKEMIFESNYGTLDLSFSDKMAESSNIKAMVGVGKINLQLPNENNPYIVKITSTPMCKVTVPKYLKNLGDNTYVSKAYRENSENLMRFNIDVSVGSVNLK